MSLTHLARLEAESIQIFREAVAESEKPVMLYSVGKDSSVMLHLARKAFFPSSPPFPLLHVDTTWKFQAMYEFRDKLVAEHGLDLIVHQNPECVALGINPFDHGSATHTDTIVRYTARCVSSRVVAGKSRTRTSISLMFTSSPRLASLRMLDATLASVGGFDPVMCIWRPTPSIGTPCMRRPCTRS